ncbi:GNAT family N-acetyltransferase [Chondromyces apiculatus]|uniref:GCN5-related N-acetyltransferase n=1 Tax=Chondromyces apiculatus DSM 436 TaxID=1192034 RepID=A0A017T703_9BACT|nr:GNAT family N-acetyltransferase [Chondromyces apiculatus]EYF04802.1 GCN5-related N-acetyltransferase [Chondromyces apiculatus DSM 436]
MGLDPQSIRTATLSDGTRVTLRMVRPEDQGELLRQFRLLSPETRYRRFHSLAIDLSDATLRYLTEVDGVNHVAIVAATDSFDLKRDEGLGIARFIRLPDEPDVAEAAVTVVDRAQGKGLGRLLLATLVEAAVERGIRRFRTTVLTENAPMRALLQDAGAILREDDRDTLVFEVPLEPPSAPPSSEAASSWFDDPAHPLRSLLRIAAQYVISLQTTLMGERTPPSR